MRIRKILRPATVVAVLALSVCAGIEITDPSMSGAQTAPAKKADTHAPVSGIHELKIGDAAPDFSLPGIDGKTHSLAEYKGAEILMVVFLSNHCPDSHAAQGRILKLAAEMKDKGLVVVAINPNHPDGVNIDELGYSKYSDSFEDMKKYAADTKLMIPYLYDGDKQTVARAYGCLATPHVFIFDAQRKLRYKGQFDDSRFAEESTVHTTDARDAVVALLAHRPVKVAETRPHGCSTKWLENRTSIAAAVAKWDKTPVDIIPIDAAGVAALRKNGTKKVRLFNVWATWCVPCVAEFPELVKTSRQFSMRDFELITISLDDPKEIDKAKSFLEKQGAGVPSRLKPALKAEGRPTNSYLYTGTNNDLIAALDPDWPGPAPHTVLVGPKGNVIWRHNGPIDGDELRAKIIEFMGEYYTP